MENTTLNHWGIKGMRWGIRRFQNKDGSLTPAGKKRYDDTPEDPETAKKAYEEGKQKALKTGSATDVLKYKGDLTKTEMDAALSRIRWEDEMRKYSDKELAPGKSKTEQVMDKVGNLTDYAVKGAKAWNMIANVVNAFSGTDGVSLPKIDTNIDSGNKDKRKAEKKEKKKAEEAQKKREEQEAQKETKQKERAEKRAKDSAEDKVYEGEVIDGPSKSSDTGKSKTKPIIDLDDSDWSEVPVSSAKNTNSYALGQRYIAGLLEEPK